MAENIFGGLFATLVETIHIELSDETVDIPMPEVLWQDSFLELFNVLDGKLFPISRPLDNPRIFVVLSKKDCTLMI